MKVIIDTGVMDIRNALTSEITDFEVAVMAESAIQNKVDCFVTRNTEGIYRVSQKSADNTQYKYTQKTRYFRCCKNTLFWLHMKVISWLLLCLQ